MADQTPSTTGSDLGGGTATSTGASHDGNTGGATNLVVADDANDAAETTASSAAHTATSAVKSLGSTATDQVRTLADTGKARASGALGEFAKMLDDAAGQVDEKLGEQFGGYARQASGVVRNFADGLDGKDVDDIVEDVRAFVQKSPAVAIGTAAALGFVVARVLRSGVDANRA